ncbi:VOC family protein [Microlunatus soli]|uniref:VOC domain-containing protein n=1 Tax=Microlunatus soli TaxID=630515 RepID=A0A1H1UZW2_9ACTN|nr:VOC family protein [Microlunatus soli]SDS78084.1 hypothetical protein SAMN04489812_3008 [Microlunatus soli]
MSTIVGRFIRHELRTVDPATAIAFYEGLFGWTTEPYPMGRIIRAGATVIGGISEVKPGLGGHWTPYIGAADVDAVATAAAQAGGIVTTGEPADVPGLGRLAPILDRDMSIFCSFAPLEPSEPATSGFVWDRLRTPDVAAAADFYAGTVGWQATVAPDGAAAVFDATDGTRVAEALAVADGEPTGWLPFVGVADLETARGTATRLGGTATESAAIAGVGSYAVVTDPEGATLAVFEPEH